MVLIIEACKAIRLLHDHLKSSFSMILIALGHKNAHNFAALRLTLNSLRDSAPGIIYFIRPQLAKDGGFPEKSACFLYRTISPDFYTAR